MPVLFRSHSTANLFLRFEPLAGQRHVKVTDSRTTRDFAEAIRDLIDSYPMAQKIVLVFDNLTAHRSFGMQIAISGCKSIRCLRIQGARRILHRFVWTMCVRIDGTATNSKMEN